MRASRLTGDFTFANSIGKKALHLL
jgi:hypothetical protein